MAIPQPKSAEIIEELNEYFLDEIMPDQFKLNRMKNDAHKIMKDDHVNGYVILGVIACIEKDFESMHKHHQNAIKLSNSNLSPLIQYAVSLKNSDLPEEAFKIAKEAYALNKNNLATLSILVSSIGTISAKNEFEEKFENEYNRYADEYKAVTGKEHHSREFLEDSDEYLSRTFDVVDELIEKKPELLIELDEDLLNEMSELVKGVDIGELE